MSDSELVLEKSLNIWRRERPRDGRRSGHKAESEMSAWRNSSLIDEPFSAGIFWPCNLSHRQMTFLANIHLCKHSVSHASEETYLQLIQTQWNFIWTQNTSSSLFFSFTLTLKSRGPWIICPLKVSLSHYTDFKLGVIILIHWPLLSFK